LHIYIKTFFNHFVIIYSEKRVIDFSTQFSHSFCVLVKVQKSDHPHCWDPCVNYCHSQHPGHCKTSTWTSASSNPSSSQDYCKCKHNKSFGKLQLSPFKISIFKRGNNTPNFILSVIRFFNLASIPFD